MFIRFFKIVPLGAPRFSKDSKMEESIYQDGLTTNNDHQSFWNPRCSKLGNIFIFFALTLWSQNLFPFFKNIDKIQNDKDVWNQKFIHFMQMLTLKQSLHLSKVYENIHDQKDKQKLPLVDPSS